MSYGIEIKNTSGDIIIDEKHANYYLQTTAHQSASPSSTYPPSGTSSTDLIFARPANGENKTVSVRYFDATSNNVKWADGSNQYPSSNKNFAGAPTSYKYYRAKKYSDRSVPSGMGLQVFGSNGDLYFTTTDPNSIEIVAVGNSKGLGHVTFPSTSGVYTNLGDYYCLMNTSVYNTFSEEGYGLEYSNFYTYEWTTSTSGRIKVTGEFIFGEGSSDDHFPARFDYMIIKVLG